MVVPGAVAVSAALLAAVTDISRYKVYNLLTFPLVATGLLYHALAPIGLGMAHSSAGLIVGFAVLILPYAMGGIGAGDVKFLAGIGAWLGPEATVSVLLIGCVATGIYSAIVICRLRGLKGIFENVRFIFHSLVAHAAGPAPSTESVQTIARQADRRERLVPFSAMLAIGVWCVVSTNWSSAWMVVNN